MQFGLHLILSRQFIDIFINIYRKDCFPALDEGFQETFRTQTKLVLTEIFQHIIPTFSSVECSIQLSVKS